MQVINGQNLAYEKYPNRLICLLGSKRDHYRNFENRLKEKPGQNLPQRNCLCQNKWAQKPAK